MKKSRFSEAQIAIVLKLAEEGTAIGQVCRKAGISQAAFHSWRKKYGGLLPSEMRRLKHVKGSDRARARGVRALCLPDFRGEAWVPCLG